MAWQVAHRRSVPLLIISHIGPQHLTIGVALAGLKHVTSLSYLNILVIEVHALEEVTRDFNLLNLFLQRTQTIDVNLLYLAVAGTDVALTLATITAKDAPFL